MRRIVAALAASGLVAPGMAGAAPTPPNAAPAPQILLAQVDDSDLADEPTISDIINEEVDVQSKSVTAAVGLSFIPGAGWGLLYAGKRPHSSVPFLLSAAGYTVAGLYMSGLFDESSKTVCVHETGQTVELEVCGYARTPIKNNETDPLDPRGRPYFRTADAYTRTTVGDDFDGTEVGIYILVGTYVVTTLIGAAWAGATVADFNDQVRKDAESTVQGPSLPRPVVGYDGQRTSFGFALDF